MPLVLFNPQTQPLSGATMPGQSGPGSNGNEGEFCIPQSPSITGTSPSDCLESYPRHSLGGLISLQRCSQCIQQPQPTGQIFYWNYRFIVYFGNREYYLVVF